MGDYCSGNGMNSISSPGTLPAAADSLASIG
jgi:hypothetical protein